MRLDAFYRCLAVAAWIVLLLPGPAPAEPPGRSRETLVRLQADSDEGIRLAQAMKDWLMTDLESHQALQSAKYLIVQQWVVERGIEGLDERELALYRDPSRYDRPIIQVIWVAAGKARTEAVLIWDLSLGLWTDLSREVTTLMAALGRTFAAARRHPVRVVVRFRDAEVLRIVANPDGLTETIFSYR